MSLHDANHWSLSSRIRSSSLPGSTGSRWVRRISSSSITSWIAAIHTSFRPHGSGFPYLSLLTSVDECLVGMNRSCSIGIHTSFFLPWCRCSGSASPISWSLGSCKKLLVPRSSPVYTVDVALVALSEAVFRFSFPPSVDLCSFLRGLGGFSCTSPVLDSYCGVIRFSRCAFCVADMFRASFCLCVSVLAFNASASSTSE